MTRKNDKPSTGRLDLSAIADRAEREKRRCIVCVAVKESEVAQMALEDYRDPKINSRLSRTALRQALEDAGALPPSISRDSFRRHIRECMGLGSGGKA